MFGDTQEATADATQQDAEAQNNVGHSIFDSKVPIGSTREEYSTPAIGGIPASNTEQQQATAPAEAGKEKLFSDSLFAKDTQQSQTATEINDELLAKLEANGYKVEKAEVVDEDVKVQEQLTYLNGNIQKAKDFMNQSDAKIVEEKVKNDKADLYNQTGRAHLINTEEFNIEVEAEIDANYSNDGIKKVYADNIRRTIQTNVIDKSAQEAQKITAQQEVKLQGIIQEKTKKLESAFDKIYKEGYMGIKFDETAIRSAYDNILNGKFTQEIKNAPEELAELALVYYQKKALKEKTAGPTYGEGVRDAAKSFEDKGGHGGSPIGSAMQRAAENASGNSFNINKWLQEEAGAENNKRAI